MNTREDYEKLTVKELQTLLKNANQPTNGKKAELIDRLLAISTDSADSADSEHQATEESQDTSEPSNAEVTTQAEEKTSTEDAMETLAEQEQGEKRSSEALASSAASSLPSPKRVQTTSEAKSASTASTSDAAASSSPTTTESTPSAGSGVSIRCVCIEGLQRPLNDNHIKNLEKLIRDFGSVTDFYVHPLKSFVLADFDSTHSASACVAGMNGVKFPDESRPPLKATIVPIDSIKTARATNALPPRNTALSDMKPSSVKTGDRVADKVLEKTKTKPTEFWQPSL